MVGTLGPGIGVGRAARFKYVATAGQTTFSGADASAQALTMNYTPGYLEVAVDGIWLSPDEYTATNGSSIVFPVGLAVGRVVYAYALSTYSVAIPYSLGDMSGMANGTLAVSASAGALTVAVKTFLGADPSPNDPVYFFFRDNTLTSGLYTRIAVTAALSVVLGSTKTLGVVSFPRLYITAHNNAGAVQIGAFIASDATGIWCPQEHLKYTTTVPDNVAKAFHTTAAIGTAAPWRFIGECEWLSSQTPGTWTAPDIVQLWTAGMKKPGDLVQTIHQPVTATNLSGTTLMTYIGVPTNTLGDQYMTQAITPASAANRLTVDVKFLGVNTRAGGNWNAMALFQDSVTNAVAATVIFMITQTGGFMNIIHYEALAATASSTTFKVRAGGLNVGTTYLNNDGAPQAMLGTVADSYIKVQEFKG